MWTRLPNDVANLILKQAACDEATVRKMACVSKGWQQWTPFNAPLPLNSKAVIASIRAVYLQGYLTSRQKQML